MSDRTSPPVPPPPPTQTSDGRKRSGNVIVLSTARQSDPSSPSTQSALAESRGEPHMAAAPEASTAGTSTSGRPMDVHSDVQWTSAPSTTLTAQAPLSVDKSLSNAAAAEPNTTVHHDTQAASVAELPQRISRRQRKQKRKTALDERGGYRHTVRLDPKGEKKLRAVAEILGVDLNAAISVCISVHYHRLTKSEGSDV